MTPLARKIIETPPDVQSIEGLGLRAGLIAGAHGFEISDILQAATDLAHREYGDARIGEAIRLPAKRVWMEARYPDHSNGGFGVLLEGSGDSYRRGRAFVAWDFPTDGVLAASPLCTFDWNRLLWGGEAADALLAIKGDVSGRLLASDAMLDVIGALAIMNEPRLHERREKRFFVRRSVAAEVGKHPLRSWHEIVLHVDREVAQVGGEAGSLTGRKALHFVRGHLRMLPSGRLTWIKPHMRGDAALGETHASYRVTP